VFLLKSLMSIRGRVDTSWMLGC